MRKSRNLTGTGVGGGGEVEGEKRRMGGAPPLTEQRLQNKVHADQP